MRYDNRQFQYVNPYSHMNQQMMHPYPQQPYIPYQQFPMQQPVMQASQLLQNPFEPKPYQYYNEPMYTQQYAPTPKKQPPQLMSNVLNSFKSENGQYDFNKMVNTTGQLVNIVSQVSNVAKGIGSFFIKV